MQADVGYGVADVGLYALDALRMEKGYKAWGLELTTEITSIECGLERFVDFDSPFIGRDAVRERARKGVASRLVYLAVDAVDADADGSEPVYADGRMVGLTTSGVYGYAVDQCIAFVEPDCAAHGRHTSPTCNGAPHAALLRNVGQPLCSFQTGSRISRVAAF